MYQRWITVFLLIVSLTACSHDKTPPYIAKEITHYYDHPHVKLVVMGDHLRFIIASDDLFGVNTPRLTANGVGVLDDVIETLKDYPQERIMIMGFSDDVGSAKFNRQLSLREAQSVLGYLWAHGMSHKAMHAVGYGKDKESTIASNRTNVGNAMNRRIELHLRQIEKGEARELSAPISIK